MIKRLNIYISHSKKMNYEMELYKPLLNSKIGIENNLILPHSKEYNDVDTKQILIDSNLLIAEVSISGTCIGIELGRAECNNVRIICLLKKGVKCNSSVKRNFKVLEYSDENDMIAQLEKEIYSKD